MTERDHVQEMFAERVGNAATWFRNSRALFASARASRERCIYAISPIDRMDMDRVVSMLYGFGLECLFKALIVLKDFGDPHDEEWRPEPEFPKKLATHDLEKLAGLVDAELPKRYEWELKYFSEAVIWMGRYPCSKSGEEGSIFIDPRCFSAAEELYEKYSIRFSISG